LPFGTRAKTLRMKCTRQRCHAAPRKTAAIAAFRPVWASEMTKAVPVSRREAGQLIGSLGLVVDHVQPQLDGLHVLHLDGLRQGDRGVASNVG